MRPPRRMTRERQPSEHRQEDRAQGRSGQGGATKTAGRVTGSRRLRAKGHRDQAKGNLKQAVAKIKDAFGP